MVRYCIDCHLTYNGRGYTNIRLGIFQDNGTPHIESVPDHLKVTLSGIINKVYVPEGTAGGRIVDSEDHDLVLATICRPRQILSAIT